ncbi:MAG: glycosyltransferase [Actinomycetota bacterium]|nr:glycosyltransferase [Actinomycetota bacterium]
MFGGTLPRVRMCANSSAADVAHGVDAALDMLAGARRIIRVSNDELAHIVHTVGSFDAAVDRAALRVHTVDRIPLRDGRMAPATWWLRGERRRVRGSTMWLAHGQTAGRMLVDAGLAAGEWVHCLPLMLPPSYLPSATSLAGRTAVRACFEMAPGVRLVIGIDPHADDHRASGWARAVLDDRRRDVRVAQISPARVGSSDRYQVRLPDGGTLPGPLRLSDLLAAADLFVASGHDLEACSPAVAAVACGVPVVAVITDSIAEHVLSNGSGFVVPGRASSVAQAVRALLDTVPPPRRAPTDQTQPGAELARGLLAAYRRVLSRSAMGGAA